MKIKLFYQKYKQALWDLESQVNGFMADVEVIDVKYTKATVGNSEDMDTLTSVMILYK
ncbi:TPA: sporulation protein Cse60 [Streptococcus pneumoniae]|nr:sporulation protein Cse60 [Streptococcus pneumoniae]